MKIRILNFTVIFILILLSVSNNANAAKASYENAITVDPVTFFFRNVIYFTYEKELNQLNSFTIKGGFYYNKLKGNTVGEYDDVTWTHVGVGGTYRWYFDLFKTRQKAIEGFAVGPKVMLNYWMTDRDAFKGGLTVSVGGEAIYKWIWDSFTLEVGLNLDFSPLKLDDYTPNEDFKTVVAIGYAW